MRRAVLLSWILSSLILTQAMAQGFVGPDGWVCFDTLPDLLNYQTDGSVRLNNITLREESDFVYKAPKITLKASIANRSSSNIVVSLELVGSARNSSLFAVSARPSFDAVKSGDNAEISSSIYAEKNTLSRADGGCIKLTVFQTK